MRPPASVATFSERPFLIDTSWTNLVTSAAMLDSSFSLAITVSTETNAHHTSTPRRPQPYVPNFTFLVRLKLPERDEVLHESYSTLPSVRLGQHHARGQTQQPTIARLDVGVLGRVRRDRRRHTKHLHVALTGEG